MLYREKADKCLILTSIMTMVTSAAKNQLVNRG